jgi:hypothetical protein
VKNGFGNELKAVFVLYSASTKFWSYWTNMTDLEAIARKITTILSAAIAIVPLLFASFWTLSIIRRKTAFS